MLKLLIVGRRRGGTTLAQLHRYMVDVHGALVLRCIADHPDETPQRYVQNHVFDGSFRVPDGSADPFMVSRDFVTQVWFKDPAQAQAATTAAFYREQLQPDEDRFVDQTSVVKLPVAERALFDAGVAPGPSKVFVFHRGRPGATRVDVDRAGLTLWQPLLAEAGRHAITRVVRNEVLALPGPAPTVDWVDEIWLRDDAAARTLGERWQSLIDAPGLAPLLAAGSGVVLLAHERVMFAGSV